VRIKGHLQSMRDLGQIMFLIVRDASATIQVVVTEASLQEHLRLLTNETPCYFEGYLQAQQVKKRKETKATEIEAKQVEAKETAESQQTAYVPPTSGVELVLTCVEALASGLHVPPIEIGKQTKIDNLSASTLLDYRPLTLRNEKVRAIFKIEAEILKAFRHFLNSENFIEIHSPKIVATGTEGGAQLFKIDYFGRTAYLAQSPQFYKQIMVGAFERVYEVGPVYRAEEHDTTRHLNEYISLDIEMGFIESEQDVIAMQIGLLRHIMEHLKENCQKELAMYQAVVPTIGSTLPQIRLEDAQQLLASKYGWKSESADLDGEGEKLLTSHFEKEEGIDMVYVTDYPHSIRPFYAMPGAPLRSGEAGSKSFDLLFRGLEITTGGQRIHEYEQLTKSIASRGLNPEDFNDYLLCFKHGMPPHGGLAIGLERLAKQLLGLPSVKQTALFPRDINRIVP
ncbi:MAG: nondiscriminating aspartyl-tRNA synthetase, partial [Cyanobacteriota bacterium erpe_2018_sw_21hr_WHONDRS-SW48-000092_B_bin.40]|nr:nondiscriminating aspartyl-tRNA synthetase [Cyanobacteriota bacterium erpe_2018_sw_21hr_WHONDRS-SW48-000092_B_bin.40]